jgi:hypothetical protein
VLTGADLNAKTELGGTDQLPDQIDSRARPNEMGKRGNLSRDPALQEVENRELGPAVEENKGA